MQGWVARNNHSWLVLISVLRQGMGESEIPLRSQDYGARCDFLEKIPAACHRVLPFMGFCVLFQRFASTPRARAINACGVAAELSYATMRTRYWPLRNVTLWEYWSPSSPI